MERKADGDGFPEGSLHWGRSLEEGKGGLCALRFLHLLKSSQKVCEAAVFIPQLVDEEN